MSNWKNRVRSEIKLTSPSGLVFTAGWKGDEMSFEKRVGQFDYPMINGTLTQDLGRGGFLYPLTIYFEGADNDIESLRFMRALGENGPWQVVHPVDGLLTLQPVGKPKRSIQPVESGNLTVVSTDWIVPIEAEGFSSESSSELAAETEKAILALDDATETVVVTGTVKKISSQVVASITAVRRNIAALKKSLVSMTARVNAIVNTISSLLTGIILDMEQISGAVMALMESPDLIKGTIVSKTQTLKKVGEQFIQNLPMANRLTLLDRNAAIVGELFLGATLSAMAGTITSGIPDSRSEALSILSAYLDFSGKVTAALDDLNSRTADKDLESQYFGGIKTAEAIANLRSLVERYLLSIICDLKKERRLVLECDRHPLEIAITEYPVNSGNVDMYYEIFCRSNKLQGRELVLLPAGREVLIYE